MLIDLVFFFYVQTLNCTLKTKDLFELIDANKWQNLSVSVSYLEIYMDQIIDLMGEKNAKKLQILVNHLV